MNIDEYRQIVAEEKARSQSTTQTAPTGTPSTEANQPPQTPPQTATTPEPPAQTETKPEVKPIVLDGQEITSEQIKEWKNGYLRQSDYTKKTQELAKSRRELEQAVQVYNAVAQNPQIAQALVQQVPILDPQVARIQELEAQYYDKVVENEVATLSAKYPDFNVQEVMQLAVDRKLNSLEDAYFVNKALKQTASPASSSTPPVTSTPPVAQATPDLVKQIVDMVKAELQPPPDTSSLITNQGGNAPTNTNSPQLTPEQMKTATMFNMSPEEYAKWANKK